ncbi:O-antigen ligase family protein [Candidatus Peregrinibacteria bacterium]|nr:O-antigen ligase family protein [Candidatus Peregrinibacteria bacterium]
MNISKDKILLWATRIGLALTLLAPSIKLNSFFFPYIMPRAVYFQVIVEIIFALAVVLVLFYPKYRPSFSSLFKAILIFLAVGALTTLTSEDISKSFIGTIERSMGYFHVLHYGMLFFVLTVALKTEKEWDLFIGANTVACLIPAFIYWGSIILAGLNPEYGHLIAQNSHVITGNPLFLAAYLLFNIFFAIYLFQKTSNRWLKAFFVFVAVVAVATILNSNVRGVFLGLCAGIFIFLAYKSWTHKEWRPHFIGVILILGSLYALVFINKNTDFLRSSSIVQRVTNFSFQDETIKARFAMWKMAIAGFKERPLAGWGRENYSIVFNKHFDTSFDDAKVGEGWEDRTHNFIFDELINGGLLGLFAYLGLLGVALWTVRKHPLFIAMLGAYAVQNLTGVDNLNSYLPLFIFIALADGLFNQKIQQDHPNRIIKPVFQYGIGIATVCIMLASMIGLTIRPARANTKAMDGYVDLIENLRFLFDPANKGIPTPTVYYENFLNDYKASRAFSKNFPAMNLELSGILGSSIIQQVEPMAQTGVYNRYFDVVVSDLKQIHARNKFEQRWSIVLAQLLMQKSIVNKDVKYLNESREIASDLLILAPKRKLFNIIGTQLNNVFKHFEGTTSAPQTTGK